MRSIPNKSNRDNSHFDSLNHDASQTSWVRQEFAGADLGDERLNQRLSALAEDFSAQPEASIPKATGSWGQACAAYRFFDNGKVTMDNILASHRQSTLERAQEQAIVLAVQDSSSLSFTTHPQTKGLGPIRNKADSSRGVWLHTTMALSVEGVSLGIVDAQSWARNPEELGKSRDRHRKPIEEKESYKWLKSFEATERASQQTPQSQWVSIGDRESDLYELFSLASKSDHRCALLVRANHNRQVEHDPKDLWNFLQNQPLAGTLVVKVPRQKGRPARSATWSIRFGQVSLKPPCDKEATGGLTLWGILAQETQPPQGVEPIQWRLLTTLAVQTLQEAIEKIRWYTIRWQIEVFHKILKSGCRAEDRQLETAERLKRVLALDMIVAWRILFLTKLGRETPSGSVATILAEHEWKALYCFVHKTTQLPDQPPSPQEAMRMIGRLGGFLGRKGDGFPGSICLWRGLHRLNDIAATWLLFNSTKDVRNA